MFVNLIFRGPAKTSQMFRYCLLSFHCQVRLQPCWQRQKGKIRDLQIFWSDSQPQRKSVFGKYFPRDSISGADIRHTCSWNCKCHPIPWPHITLILLLDEKTCLVQGDTPHYRMRKQWWFFSQGNLQSSLLWSHTLHSWGVYWSGVY